MKKKDGFIKTLNLIMIFCISFAMASILLANYSLAANIANISGKIIDGQEISIYGSGFGSNGPNLVLFDDFENGTVGATINTGGGSATIGSWGATNFDPYYNNITSVSGSLALQADMSKHWAVWAQANLPPNTRNIFISWWLYLPANDKFPGEGNPDGINWKQMWLQGSSTTDDDLVLPTKLEKNWFINGNDKNPGYTNYIVIDFKKGSWKRVWVWLKGGYNNDGSCHFWELTSSGILQRENDNNVNTLKSGGAWEKVRVNGYGRSTSNCHPTFDDVYIATGPFARARVEIGNKPKYVDCSKMTILTPVSWSDQKVVATVRQGAFHTGETAYVFIVDANGNLNSTGFPIVIGTGEGVLSAPENLRIVDDFK